MDRQLLVSEHLEEREDTVECPLEKHDEKNHKNCACQSGDFVVGLGSPCTALFKYDMCCVGILHNQQVPTQTNG